MEYCHGCLKQGYNTFCPACLRKLFSGAKVSNILSFTQPEFNEIRLAAGPRLSISGIQPKHSARLEQNGLVLTEKNGEYILKMIPSGPFRHLEFIPANEHLTMQLAGQLFKIQIPPNALIFFKDLKPLYIIKRFDILPDGSKLLQEDFAQIAEKTEENSGKNYKYDFSYEEIAELIKKHVGAYPVELEKFFRLVLFNYIVCNGDAHLKNFSVFRNSRFGDYILTPAYDLVNTSIHVPGEKDTALELFKDNYITESYTHGSKYTKSDFEEFGLRIGIRKSRIDKILNDFLNKEAEIKDLTQRSFLSEELKLMYIDSVLERIERIRY